MRTSRIAAVVLSLLVAFTAADALSQSAAGSKTGTAAPASLVHRGQGVEFEVTADGLSAIRVGDRTLASGGWNLLNAEPWFKDAGTGAVKTGPVERKSLEVLGPRQARVTQAGGQVVSTVDYTFEGDDVTISAHVENRHPDAPLNVLGFSGLTFDFDRPPEGIMQVQHISYFQAHGLGLCHPSFWSKIGGSYAIDNTVGVGVSPWKTGWVRTLILWDYGSWAPDQREKSPQRRLVYFVAAPIPAGGARTVEMKLRVSTQRDWQHLLAPYREHFRATFGLVRYDADHRWIASDYLNHSQQAVSPTNPYGFHGGHRRLDLREGAEAFCDTLIPALKSAGGQGVILWGQGGDDPRGSMYRPDFDILPPEVEQNWPTVVRRFKEAGLKLGVTARPADLALRLDWKQDQVIPINADDPAHCAMLWRRFQKMMDRGCTLFYLDSFGADLEHVKLMRFLRERLGRKILCFSEHQCDAILPYSGGYSETSFRAGDPGGPAYRVWSGTENWRIYQWLVPDCQLVSRLYQVEGRMPPDFEPVDRFFYRHRITPLVPVSDFRRVPALKQMQGVYVETEGRWKDHPEPKQ